MLGLRESSAYPDIGNQPGGPSGSRILPQTDGQNVFDITTAAGFQKLYFSNFEIDGFFAVNDVAFHGILANGLTFNNIHFNLIKAFHLDRVDEVYIHNTVVGSDVDAFFGSTVDTAHSFDIMIDGWIQQSSSPYTISGPLLHFQRAVSAVLNDINYRGLSDVPLAIQFSNDCQGNSITDSTIVNAATGVKFARNTVGSTTASPSWNRIDNFMCDACAVIGIDVENGSWFNTITQAYFTTIASGDTGIILRVGSLANIVTGSVFQNMLSGGTGIMVEAGVSEFAISDSYFSGIGGSTGIDIQSGVSDAYNIIGNVFNGAGTYLSDGGTGSNKNIVGNVPGVASNLSSPLLRLDAQTQFVDTGTKPSCGVSNRFVLWVEEGGSGIKDAVEICAKNSSNSYGWRVIY